MFDLSFNWPDLADAALRGTILSVLGLAWIILLVNIVGLRSFSKMTSFDFVMTVAMGSLLATIATVSEWTGFVQAMTAAVALFIAQYIIARIRKSSDKFESFIQNQPLLLMRNGEFIDEALEKSRVAKDDLIAKMRESNVLHMSEVRAAVLEATGDVSVLHGESMDEFLLSDVNRGD